MDLQQQLRRSPFAATPWSEATDDGSGSATLGEAVVDLEAGLDQTIAAPTHPTAGSGDPVVGPDTSSHLQVLPPSDRTSSYLTEIRLSPSAARRPIDRLLRLLDVVGALLGLFVAAPILAVASVAILATSRGPVFFSQDRVGRDGRSFRCYKLRTMRSDAESQLVNLLDRPEYVDQWQRARKLDDDPRVTRVGRILRATDLDELPQFWNVLRGEMSLVGPRPVPEDEAEWYGPDLATVLSVRPGMTGMWQVGGRHQVSYEQRIALDVRYVATRGVWINTRLLVRTVALIVSGRNGAS